MEFIQTLGIGLICGTFTGLFYKKRGYGMYVDILMGIIGAFFGNMILASLGPGVQSDTGRIASSLLGACLFLLLINLVSKKSKKL